MALSERLALLVSLDAQGAVRGLEKVGKAADRNLGRTETRVDRMGQKFQKVGTGMLASAGLLATGLYKAGQSAADLEQAIGGTEAVFGDASGTIDKFASNAASKMGLSEREFREATTSIGGQLKRMTGDLGFATDKSVELTGVAADLAATYGGTTAEAVQALGAAFRGEADPAERFNLNLKIGAANAKAVALGLADSEANVSEAARAQATYALIMEQSTDAQGQFNRELGTASVAMQIANAEFENAKASLGQAVAPILADVAGKAADLAGGFQGANEASGGLLSSLAAYGTIGLGAAGGLSLIVGKAIELRGQLKKMGTAGKIAAGAGGLLALVAVSKSLADAFDGTQMSLQEFSGLTERELISAVNEAAAGFEALGSDGLEPFRILAEQSIGTAQRLRDELHRQGEDTSDLDKILKDAAEAQRQATADQEAAIPVVEGLSGATGGLGSAQADLAEQAKAADEAQSDLTAAIRDQFDAITSALEANISWEDALDDLTEGLKENGRTLDITTEKGRANAENLLATKDALVGVIEQRFAETGSMKSATAAGELYVEGLKNQLREAGFTEDQISDLVRQYGLVPRQVSTTVTANTSQASGALSGVLAQLDAVSRRSGTNVLINASVRARERAGRWGMVNEYATGGIQGHIASREIVRYAEPSTGGEAFIPKNGDFNRSMAILQTAAGWYGMSVGKPSAPAAQPIIVQIGDEVVARLVVNGGTKAGRRGIG